MWLVFAEDAEFADAVNDARHRLPLMWFVVNIDDVYAEFQGRGISIAAPLQVHPYGLREFAFVDLNGYYIRVAEGV